MFHACNPQDRTDCHPHEIKIYTYQANNMSYGRMGRHYCQKIAIIGVNSIETLEAYAKKVKRNKNE